MLDMVKIDGIRYVETNLARPVPTSAATSGANQTTDEMKQRKIVESQAHKEAAAQNKSPIAKTKVEAELEQMNQFLQSMNTDLSFMLDEDSQIFFVKIINMETKEVIKQIPPEEFLKTVAKIRSMIGAIIDEMV